MRTIRASEIGTYLYCRRAWWYQRRGVPSENQAELAGGTEVHLRHGRTVFASGLMRLGAYAAFLAALLLAVIAILQAIL
ncbi:MAG: hypothetical protein ACK2UW_24080 [Anaerolineales bacterium]|jgi:CRISPR/Cas system-associated exonuclease Cas4 (RecB family)